MIPIAPVTSPLFMLNCGDHVKRGSNFGECPSKAVGVAYGDAVNGDAVNSDAANSDAVNHDAVNHDAVNGYAVNHDAVNHAVLKSDVV